MTKTTYICLFTLGLLPGISLLTLAIILYVLGLITVINNNINHNKVSLFSGFLHPLASEFPACGSRGLHKNHRN